MGQRVFTVRGRAAYPDRLPSPRIWVSIVDADRGDPDDSLGIGRSNAAGEFRLSFTTSYAAQEGVHWLEKAAEQGEVEAMQNLALLYLAGADVPKDLAASFAWTTKAAEHGSVSATQRLVVTYTHGIGTDRDFVSARLWEKRAQRAEVVPARLRNT